MGWAGQECYLRRAISQQVTDSATNKLTVYFKNGEQILKMEKKEKKEVKERMRKEEREIN